MNKTILTLFVALFLFSFASASYQVIKVNVDEGWNGFAMPMAESQMDWTEKNITLGVGPNLIGWSANKTVPISSINYYFGDVLYNYSQAVSLFNLQITETVGGGDAIGDNTSSFGASFKPYKAYWISTNTSGSMNIVGLYSGKTDATYNLADIRFINDTTNLSIGDAVGAGWVQGSDASSVVYYAINSLGSVDFEYILAEDDPFVEDDIFTLNSWEGYFINGLQNVSLYREDAFGYYADFYNLTDNNATLTGSGTGTFGVQVNDSNGTVILKMNGITSIAVNTEDSLFTTSIEFNEAVNYDYYWETYSSDGFVAQSEMRSYSVAEGAAPDEPSSAFAFLLILMGVALVAKAIMISLTEDLDKETMKVIIILLVAICILGGVTWGLS